MSKMYPNTPPTSDVYQTLTAEEYNAHINSNYTAKSFEGFEIMVDSAMRRRIGHGVLVIVGVMALLVWPKIWINSFVEN